MPGAAASETIRSWTGEFPGRAVVAALRPLQMLTAAPSLLFLLALTAMLLRHPDVRFYEMDRVAFGLLVAGVSAQAVVMRQRLLTIQRATWPMMGLIVLALISLASQPFEPEAWNLLASKFHCAVHDVSFGGAGLHGGEIFSAV